MGAESATSDERAKTYESATTRERATTSESAMPSQRATCFESAMKGEHNMKGQHMTDDEALRGAILMRALDYSNDVNMAMAIAERMRRFVYGVGYESLIKTGDLTESIKSALKDFEGPIQGFDGVAIPGKMDDDYEVGETGRRRSTRERTRHRWTDAEVAEVRQYLAQGLPLDEIAEAIGRSWMAVEKSLRDGRFA